MKKTIYLSLLLVGVVCTGCSTYQYTARQVDVLRRSIGTQEQMAGVEVNYDKQVSGTSDYQLTRRDAIEEAEFHCIQDSKIDVVFQAYLVFHIIFLQLVSDIFLDCLFVLSNCTHIISCTPEFPVPVSVLQIRMPLKYHDAALSLQVSHDLRYTVLRRYLDQHMYVIRTALGLYDLYPLILTQLPQYTSYILLDVSVYYLSPVFWREYHMVLTFPCSMC